MKVVLLGVPKVVSWLVLVGVNECFLIKVQMVQNSGKKWILSLFCGHFFAGVNECIFSKVVSFWVGFWGFSGPRCQIILLCPKFMSFWVWIWGFSGPKWWIILLCPKFESFWVWIWGFSGLKWRIILLCLKFVSWVSFLVGVIIWNKCQISFPSVTGNVWNLHKMFIFEQFWGASSTPFLI